MAALVTDTQRHPAGWPPLGTQVLSLLKDTRREPRHTKPFRNLLPAGEGSKPGPPLNRVNAKIYDELNIPTSAVGVPRLSNHTICH